jgi:hypothetical protein
MIRFQGTYEVRHEVSVKEVLKWGDTDVNGIRWINFRVHPKHQL